MNIHKIRYAMVEKTDLRIEPIPSNSDSDDNQNNSSQDAEALPKLYVKLEKIDELSQTSKVIPKSVSVLNDTVSKTVNKTSTSSGNSNQDSCKDVNNTIHIKQEKVNINSAPNPPAITQGIKQESVSKSKTQSTKSVSQETSTVHSLSKTVLPKSPRIQSEIDPKPPSNKMPNCSNGKPGGNFMPFNGASFLHTQIRTNTALQTILKDIITLNKQYKYTNDHLLDDEIDKLRAKHNLPSFRTRDVDNSDFTDDSDQDWDDEGQRSESLASERTEQEEDECSEKLIIDELDDESDDEPEYVVIEKECLKKGKLMDRVFINGDIVEIDSDTPECPVCAKMFRSANALKQHIQNCSAVSLSQKDCTKDDAEVSSTAENSFSSGEKIVQEKSSNLKIGHVFSVGEEMIKCAGTYCEFIGTESQLAKHQILHSKKFRRTCKECNVVFFSEFSLENHFQTKGHSHVYPPMTCEYCDFSSFGSDEYKKHMYLKHGKRQKTDGDRPELNDAEIIEVDDD